MRLVQIVKQRETGNLIMDGIFILILLIGACGALEDMSEKAGYVFAKGKDRGEVVQLYTEKKVEKRHDTRGKRLSDKTLYYRMAKVEYNETIRTMRNTENLKEGAAVEVRFPLDSPSDWKPMRRYDLSPLSIIFPGTKETVKIVLYSMFWLFVLLMAYIIWLACTPARDEQPRTDKMVRTGKQGVFTVETTEEYFTPEELKQHFPDPAPESREVKINIEKGTKCD